MVRLQHARSTALAQEDVQPRAETGSLAEFEHCSGTRSAVHDRADATSTRPKLCNVMMY